MTTQQTLIIGANSGIAKALATEIATSSPQTGLIVISRDLSFYQSLTKQFNSIDINKIELEDYQAESVEYAIKKIGIDKQKPITRVFICNGILHQNNIKPEKRLEDFNSDTFQQVLNTNALIPMLWIQKLTPLLTSNISCKIVAFSARVGSINDNTLGGWYSYRASKAALNMMLKTASIELARRAKNIKIIAFHPGTTDTYLSKPFQKNVPKNKLFSSEFVAKQLLNIVENTEHDNTVSYLDWQGKSIDW